MDKDDDPTTTTPLDQTQRLPRAEDRPPMPPSEPPSGWRPAQVAVVALLALLLGASGGALVYFLADDDPADDSASAGETTTTTTSAEAEADDDADQPSSSTTEPEATTTVPDAGAGGPDTGGQVAVGNSIFTATYQSNQDRSTGDISVDDDWQIRWNVPDGAITIEVFDAGDDLVETIQAEGSDERSFPDGGTYRVEMSSDGTRYTVVITDGP